MCVYYETGALLLRWKNENWWEHVGEIYLIEDNTSRHKFLPRISPVESSLRPTKLSWSEVFVNEIGDRSRFRLIYFMEALKQVIRSSTFIIVIDI
jgi:hypothetical protein